MWSKKTRYKLVLLIQLLVLPFAATVFAEDYLYRPTIERSAGVLSGSTDIRSGAYTYDYEFFLPDGRNGIQPNFKLNYNNQDADQANVAGYGWSISIPYINRISKKGVDNLYPADIAGDWDPNDYYFSSSLSGEILPVDPTTTTERMYGAKVETGEFLNYEFTNNSWVVTDKLGTVYTFGSTSSTRQDDSANTDNVYKWMLEEVRDTNDNYITYSYYKDSGMIYPSSTIYTGNGSTDGIYEVIFNRESRRDTPILYNTGFSVQPNYRISDIQIKVNGTWVRKYEFDYITGDNGKRSLLNKIVESGNDGSVLTMPSTKFTYQAKEEGFATSSTWGPKWEHGPPTCTAGTLGDKRILDYNGDGLLDGVSSGPGNSCSSGNETEINNGDNSFTLNTSLGLPERVLISDYKIDNGVRFDDLNSDGYMDVVQADVLEPSSGPDVETSTVYLNDRDGGGWTASSTYSFPFQFIKHFENYPTKADDAFTHMADVNGDGFADILKKSATSSDKWVFLNNGVGGFEENNGAYDVPVDLGSYETQSSESVFLDVNGDSLVDAVSIGHDTIYVEGPGNQRYTKVTACINKDGGKNYDCSNFVIDTPEAPSTYEKITTDYDNGSKFVDVNGDGLVDFVRNSPEDYALYEGVYINKGDGTGWGYSSSQTDAMKPIYDIGSGNWDSDGMRTGDLDGDGLSDFFATDGSGEVYLNNGKKPDVLTSIDDSKGASTDIAYKNAQLYRDSGDNQANPDLPIVIQTAESITTDDGLGNFATTTYNYGGGEYYFNNAFDKRFAGFGITTTTDAVGNMNVQYFYQGNETKSGLLERQDDGSKINFVYREDMLDNSGNLYKQILNKYDNTDLGNNRDFVYLSESLVRDFDGDSDSKDSAQSFEFSTSTGNLTQQTNWGEVSVSASPNFSDTGSDKLTEQYEYATDGDYVVGLVSKQTTLDSTSSTVRETKNYYDSMSYGSASNGNKTKVESWVTSTTYVDIENTYNSYGLVVTSTDANNNQTEFDYDEYNLYVVTSTNPLSQDMVYEYSYAVGKSTKVTDVNGQVYETIYDQIGRVIGERVPDVDGLAGDTVSSTDRVYTDDYFPRIVHTKTYLNSATTTDSYVYLNGFDKKVQERAEAESGYSVRDFIYNELNMLKSESLPYFDTGLPSTEAPSTEGIYPTNKSIYISDKLSSYLTIADSDQSGLDLSGDFTLEMWLRPTTTPASGDSYSIIQKDEGSEHSYHMYYYVSGGNPYVYLVLASPTEVSKSVQYTIPEDQWTHVAITADLTVGNFSLYENGSLSVTSTSGYSSSIYDGTAPFNIFYNDSIAEFYGGRIDDLRVWSDVRTSTEISNNYQQELTGNEAGLVSYWHFNDSLTDITSNQNELSWVNGAGQFTTNTPSLTMSTSTGYYVPESFGSVNVVATSTTELYTNYTYDPLKRVKTVTNAVGTTSNVYDQWTVSTTDALGNVKDYHNDAFGRLARVTEYNGTDDYDTYYEYNGNGKLTKITDALGNIRNFEYDGLGRRTMAEDLHASADSYFGVWNYAYDNNGNMVSSTDPKSQEITYTYDVINRQLTENYTGEAGTEITYGYDGCTNGVGRLCYVVMDSTSTTLAYDALGNVSTELRTVSSTDYQTSFTYDRQGNTTLITYEDNSQVNYVYNTAGLLETVGKKESGESVFSSIVDNFDYSPLGQVTKQENANGTVTTNTYDADALYRLAYKQTSQTNSLSDPGDNRINTSTLQDIYYTYDLVGNITQLSDDTGLDNNKSVAYTYDDLYRLLTASTTISITTSTNNTNTHSTDLEKDSTQYWSITDASQTGLDLETTDLTLEAWVKLESDLSVGQYYALITKKDAGASGGGYYLDYDNGGGTKRFYFLIGNGTNDNGCHINYTLSTDTWYHIAFVYTKSTGNVVAWLAEADGSHSNIGNCNTESGGAAASSRTLGIGYDTAGYYPFDGLIDDIRVWDDTRSETELNDNFETELVGNEANLVSYWKFNNDGTDENSNGNDLTNNNSAAFSETTAFSTATESTTSVSSSADYYLGYTYDAIGNILSKTTTSTTETSGDSNTNSIDLEKDSTQYLSITDASQTGLDLTGSDLTIEMWLKLESDLSTGDYYALFTKKDAGASGGGYYIDYDNGGGTKRFYFLVGNGTNDNGCHINYTLSTDTWYHVAFVYTKSTGNVIAWLSEPNGSHSNIGNCNTESGGPANSSRTIGIGYDTSGWYPFDGLIEDIRVWDDTRSETELNDNFETELVGDEAGLVSYWKLNNDLTDKNSNGNDLTNNNSATFSTSVPFTGTSSSTLSDYTTYYIYQGDSGSNYANPHAMTTASTTVSTSTYAYDNNGNLTSYGDWTLTWDYKNRLTQSVSSTIGTTSTYQYDHTGTRVHKNVDGVESIYPNKWYSIENGTVKKHIFAGGTEIVGVQGTTTTYHHTDHLSGSSVETDEEGYVVEVIDYYPFGGIRIDETYTEDFENDKKFTGHEYDDGTGLYYMNARYQDPEIGRFISEDPVFLATGAQTNDERGQKELRAYLSDPQGFNAYSYSRNNPLRYIDPTGERFWDVITGKQSLGSYQLEVGNKMMNYSQQYPIVDKALDHPVATSAATTVAGVGAYYGSKALWGAVPGSVKIRAGVGAGLNIGNEILENKVRGEKGSFAEYAYAGATGAAAANSPLGWFGSAAIIGGSDLLGQQMFDNYTDYTSSAISAGSAMITNRLFAAKMFADMAPMIKYSGEAALSTITETAPKILNFGIKDSLK